MATAVTRLRGRVRGRSARARSEERTAWLLCLPAVAVILLVTAYPIGYAVVLSLQSLDLRFPDEGGFRRP